MSNVVRLSRIHYPVTTLGPGRRIGIWFQGCSIRCAGCISVDTWRTDGPVVSVDAVLRLITDAVQNADGITITGGEPFDQPGGLRALLAGMRPLLRIDADVLVFSGYPKERIEEVLDSCSGLIDALISDPFEISTTQTLALRGSDNQRLTVLTSRGRRFLTYERKRTQADDALDAMVDPDGSVWMAGIPNRGDLQRLRQSLAAEGTRIWTSEQHVC